MRRLSKLGSRWIRFAGMLASLLAGQAVGFAEVSWKRSPEAVLKTARRSGKPILVFVGADWCHYCTKMKRETWSDRQICGTVNQKFECLYLDGDRDKDIVRKLELNGYPAVLAYTPEGKFLRKKSGFMPSRETLQWLAALPRAVRPQPSIPGVPVR